MPFFVLVMFVKVIYEAIRVFRKKNRAAKPEPLCVGCLHAHVQYAANARRAISCAYGGAVRRGGAFYEIGRAVLHRLSGTERVSA
jgi:hypothetical protein